MVRFCASNQKCCIKHYDGLQDGLFNYSGKILVTLDLMRDFSATCKLSGITFTLYCQQKSELFNKSYKGHQFLNSTTFSKIYFAYCGLLQFDTALEPPCRACGRYPSILLADATDLGMPNKFLSLNYKEVLSPNFPPSNNIVVPFPQRVLLKSNR